MRELKRGVALSQSTTPGEYLLGTLKRVIRIYTPEEKVIALALARGKSEKEILQTPNVLDITVNTLLAQLEEEELINHEQGVLRAVVGRLVNRIKDAVLNGRRVLKFIDQGHRVLQCNAVSQAGCMGALQRSV